MEMDVYHAMKCLVDHGWTLWPPSTITDKEKGNFIIRFMEGEMFPLYPPGYKEDDSGEVPLVSQW